MGRIATATVAVVLPLLFGGSEPLSADEPLVKHLEAAFRSAASLAAPAVVAIEVDRDAAPVSETGLPAYARRPPGLVSGIAIGPARVLTSAWNVEGARRVRVVPEEGAPPVDARVVGRDETIDLALLAVEGAAPPLTPIPLSAGTPPTVGSWLIAIGRGPLGTIVVNAGIVSARGRFRGEAIQTDAALNYGNYGGAAVDIEGRMLGIAVRLSPRAGVNSGVGFVIPVDRIREALPRLERGEARKLPLRAFLGVQFGREVMDPPGLTVARVIAGTGAAEAGLEEGDVLRCIDGIAAVDASAVSEAIQARMPGERIRVVAERRGRGLCLEAVLGARATER
jgi:S1-C subfamily serine protease